jgi:hypothetical protein
MGGLDSYTKLLLHFEGADTSTTFTDSSALAHSVTANGTAQIDTAQFKFGFASGLFNGAGSLTIGDHADWNFGSGAFTIDFWARFAAFPPDSDVEEAPIFCQREDIDNRFEFKLRNTSGVYYWRLFSNSSASTLVAFSEATTLSLNTWYHVALVRTGNNFKIFQNGVQLGSDTTDTDAFPDYAGDVYMGTYEPISTVFFNGWLDEFRVSKGIARWTSNFTPPAVSYNDYVEVGRYRNGSTSYKLPGQTLSNHKLRIRKNSTTYGIPLISTAHTDASGLRIYDGSSTYAIPRETV